MHRFFRLHEVLPLALVALGAVACGGASPEVQTPTTDLGLSAPQPASAPAPVAVAPEPTPIMAAPESPLQAKQGQATKEETGEEAVARATAQVEAEANAAQQTKDKAKWEKMGRDVERKTTDMDSRDRLAKASARVAQAANQLSRVPPQRRGRYNTDMVTFGTKKADVQARISSIYAYGSDEWKRMRAELDKALDELDAAATRVEGDLF